MSLFTRGLVASTALGLALATPVSAQTQPESTSMFAPANVVGGVIRLLVTYARVVADVKYGALEIDAKRGALTMRDLSVSGIGPDGKCTVTLGQITMNGISFWLAEDLRSRLDASDIVVSTNCFGRQAPVIGMVAGGDLIQISDLTIESTQTVGSGAASLAFEIVSPSIARIEGTADFDYFSLFSPDFFQKLNYTPDYSDPNYSYDSSAREPSFGVHGTLRAAHVSVENLGIWERMQPMIPPDMITPEAINEALQADPAVIDPAFTSQLATALNNFVATPGRVTAEIRPAKPVEISTSTWKTPQDAVAALQPVISNAAPTPPLPLIADPSDQTDPRAMGLAFATGQGVPQNTGRAIELLTPLQEDGEVALALADLTADSDAAASYQHALRAAEAKTSGAAAALDRAETRLATADLFKAQLAADADLPDTAFASVINLRDQARAYEDGQGAPRSYALAWRLGSLAAAAGDGPSQSLLKRIDLRFGNDPEWLAVRNAASDQALDDWTKQSLATRLAGK